MHGRMVKVLYGDRGDAEKWVGAVRQQDDYKVTWLFLLITTLRQKNRLGPLQLCTTCNKFLFENSRPACDDGKFIILQYV